MRPYEKYLSWEIKEVKKQVNYFLPCCSALGVPEAAPVSRLIWAASWRQFRGCHSLSAHEHTEPHQVAPVTKHKRNRKYQDKFFSSKRRDFMKYIKISPKLLRRNLELNVAYRWKQIVHNECRYLWGWTQISTILTPINVSCQQVFLKYQNCCEFSWLNTLTEFISVLSWKEKRRKQQWEKNSCNKLI